MTTVEAAVLWVHIAVGFVALGAGLAALATAKGGRRHRLAGRTFVYAMAAVSGTALALYPLQPGFWRLFLALVALFSFYFAFSGYRVLGRKRPVDDPTPADWVALGVFGVASLGILALGVARYVAGSGFAPVLLVFGAIGSVVAVFDGRSFRAETAAGEWIGDHVVRMGAAYVAALSAFSAVNFGFLPSLVRWLWPTILGVPLFVALARRYEAKFAPS